MSNWEALRSELVKKGEIPKGKKRKRPEPEIPPILSAESDAKAQAKKAASLDCAVEKSGPRDTVLNLDKCTEVLAMDAEFVGVGVGGKRDALARVSIVNFYGELVYDTFVLPSETVTDYRTRFSGVRAEDLKSPNVPEFSKVQKVVADIIKNRVVVGHGIQSDFRVLLLAHPQRLVRDTSNCKLFSSGKFKRSLKDLVQTHLGTSIQEGEHDSIEDARSALALYKLKRVPWEKEFARSMRRKCASKPKFRKNPSFVTGSLQPE